MKKKILFMTINMNVGGTEKALLNMIDEIPEEKYEITILMLEERGGFLKYIPNGVKIEYLKEYNEINEILNNSPRKTVLDLFNNHNVEKGFSFALYHLVSKITKDKTYLFKYIFRKTPKLKGEYDVAIAYAGPMDFISYFIANKVTAKKKVQWIHFDINKIGFNKLFISKLYKKFNKVFVVSKEGKDKLLHQLPDLTNKTEVFSNIISSKLITQEAESGIGFQDDFKGVRILTVGRLSDEKGQDIAIRALSKLITDGFNVKWYCIGEGKSRKKYEMMRDELNLTDKFMLLGEELNPYNYIKHCDIYVQPSRHEGYCITLAEARALQKPIVTTNFTGAKEQIVNNKTGLIVRIDEHDIYQAVKKVIKDPLLGGKFSENLGEQPIEYNFEMEKLYELL
ncbi:glycosyltransferase [Virgibacillus sp. L01]|uniref:glycosyltransferase n=1 Tax=Virgibacillus sp. L01 TaxID=3457429 RepID=UPI003FD40475